MKKACDAEFEQIYLDLDQKLTKVDLLNINDQISEVKAEMESLVNLNSIKVHNIAYNNSSKNSPFRINFEPKSAVESV